MDYTLKEVEQKIYDLYQTAYEHAKPGISRLNPDEGQLGFWWGHFDRLVGGEANGNR